MNNIIVHLTDSNFSDRVLNSNNVKNNSLFLIDFWAEWCNPCKMLSPIVEEIASEFHDRLIVVKIDVDNNPVTTGNYAIKSIPTLLMIRNSVVLSTKVGLLSKKELKEFVGIYL